MNLLNLRGIMRRIDTSRGTCPRTSSRTVNTQDKLLKIFIAECVSRGLDVSPCIAAKVSVLMRGRKGT